MHFPQRIQPVYAQVVPRAVSYTHLDVYKRQKYVSALTDIGYDGCTCIEIEDKAFEDSKEKVEKSLILSKRYLEKYVI